MGTIAASAVSCRASGAARLRRWPLTVIASRKISELPRQHRKPEEKDARLARPLRGPVAAVYLWQLPCLACTRSTSFSGQPQYGGLPPSAASCELEAVSGLRHPCEGNMRGPFLRQGSE